ncbi:hypothetical protein EXIGLDRAFT_392201 [Exidia glandulosa HHB12029]|uniref:Uncharacterized protein n=1 Tax=Exidia glandulosa HHB12029 TaxID=1314781 RepID=A0A165ZB82_EXIGL|nr:hypothetical protein EXIGLDRAFT_392201 [Exidia glandulosa HHB12029]
MRSHGSADSPLPARAARSRDRPRPKDLIARVRTCACTPRNRASIVTSTHAFASLLERDGSLVTTWSSPARSRHRRRVLSYRTRTYTILNVLCVDYRVQTRICVFGRVVCNDCVEHGSRVSCITSGFDDQRNVAKSSFQRNSVCIRRRSFTVSARPASAACSPGRLGPKDPVAHMLARTRTLRVHKSPLHLASRVSFSFHSSCTLTVRPQPTVHFVCRGCDIRTFKHSYASVPCTDRCVRSRVCVLGCARRFVYNDFVEPGSRVSCDAVDLHSSRTSPSSSRTPSTHSRAPVRVSMDADAPHACPRRARSLRGYSPARSSSRVGSTDAHASATGTTPSLDPDHLGTSYTLTRSLGHRMRVRTVLNVPSADYRGHTRVCASGRTRWLRVICITSHFDDQPNPPKSSFQRRSACCQRRVFASRCAHRTSASTGPLAHHSLRRRCTKIELRLAHIQLLAFADAAVSIPLLRPETVSLHLRT